MRRILTVFMTIAVILALAGCGSKTGQEADLQEAGRGTGEGTGQEVSRGTGGETGQGTGQSISEGTGEENVQNTTDREVGWENGSVYGDGGSGSLVSSKEDADAQQTESSKETIELRDDYEDNFDVDEKAAAEFGRRIKEAVAQKDVEKLAELTGFPVYVGLSGGIVVETREDFIALDAEELLSEEMVSSMAESDENNLSPSMAGFTLHGSGGAPSITFGVRDGHLAISGINYGY